MNDNLDVRKHFIEIDGVRYHKESVDDNYAANDYIDHNRDIKLFFTKITLLRAIKSFYNLY